MPWESPSSEALRHIRFAVFVDEQKVPAEMEIDDMDPIATHVLAALPEGRAVGTGRLFPDPAEPTAGRIGRMAVLAEARGLGVGSAVLVHLMRLGVDRGFARLVLDAQVHAMPFYERYGFTPEGELHWDAGILHRAMQVSAEKARRVLAG